MKRQIFIGSIGLLLVLLRFSLCMAADSYPPLEIKGDNKIEGMLNSEPNFSKPKPLEFSDIWTKEIQKGLEKVYKDMWTAFNTNGKDILPWCVYEAFNELKKKSKIVITMTFFNKTEIPTGREAIAPNFGKYYSEKMERTGRRNGIWIFGLWKDLYRKDENSKNRCLRAVVFHEMLHYALDISDKINFSVKKIKNPKVTNNENFWADEGVIEDCHLKLFSCGPDEYKYAAEAWYDNNARKYNTEDDDCASCKLCKSPDDKTCQAGPPTPDLPPGKDRPDDWHSFSSGVIGDFDLAPGTILYSRGYYKEAQKMLGGLVFDDDNTACKLFEVTPVLFFPSSSFSGKENDLIFKAILEEYVSLGGTVVVFSQQYGDHFDKLLPIPEGESLKSYGYREDSSCLKNSVYFSGMHPVLSSATNELLDAGVDGYFSVYPSESTVLLRRKANGEPALLYYPYGQGKVILTSLFTDYAASRSMASSAELRLVRDILTFAKAKTEIPMFNLEENPTPGISLNVRLTNSAETPTAKARIKAYTPNRDAVLYDADFSVSLNPGQTADVPLSFTLPTVLPAQYGICHIDYELYDAQDTIAQLSTESETGMFSIYKTPTPTVNNKQIYEWITIDSEIAYWGQEVECTMHFKNTSTQPRTVTADDPFFTIDHGETLIPCTPFSVTVNPGESYDHVVKLPTTAFSEGFNYNSQFTFRIQYYDNEGTLRQFGNAKTVFLKNALTKSSIAINNTGGIYPGQPVNYTIQSGSDAALSGETTIKLTLEKYNLETRTYTEVNTVYQACHDFSTGTYNQTTAYLPETVMTSGGYRLKLDVTSPNGVKEISRYTNFSIQPSGFRAGLGKLTRNGVITNTLLPGETYTVPVKLSNTMYPASNYNVQNGACILRLVSKKSSSELFRKEFTNLAVAYNEQTEVTESFVFNPIETGRYALEIAYKDETRENYTAFIEDFC